MLYCLLKVWYIYQFSNGDAGCKVVKRFEFIYNIIKFIKIFYFDKKEKKITEIYVGLSMLCTLTIYIYDKGTKQ